MPPKVKITREEILDAAVEIVRVGGAQALCARALADRLGCSTQPVFSNFSTMEELRLAVVKRADELCGQYRKEEMASGLYPPYKASGMAYIRFAKEEKELFKLLYMRDRAGESPLVDDEQSVALVQHNTGLDVDVARLFHLEMWVFVHGVATMFATGFFDLDWELVSRLLSDAYQGLRKQYGME